MQEFDELIKVRKVGDPEPPIPFGGIQWKGTDVCIDLHCACGESLHFDGEFFYYFSCPHCKRVYAVGHHVKLVELTDPEVIATARKHCFHELPNE